MSMLEKLIPPDDPKLFRRWSWFVAIGLISAWLAIVIVVAFILGRLPYFGGFATKDDIADIIETQKMLEIEQNKTHLNDLTQRINNTRVTQCEAVIEGNQAAMMFTYNRLQMLLDEFRQRSGYDYRVPECSELVPEIRRTIPTPTPTPSLRIP